MRRHAPLVRYAGHALPSPAFAGVVRHLGIDPVTLRVEGGRLVLPDAPDGTGALAAELEARQEKPREPRRLDS